MGLTSTELEWPEPVLKRNGPIVEDRTGPFCLVGWWPQFGRGRLKPIAFRPILPLFLCPFFFS
ncbi:hypothetical protein Csa_001695 [Cucumis sativus]|uniref:Uncharacterized protein n=1 Tax=Cucumis sativus TaxID=3659 RepID=A0A0A0LG94_CUCSA|nr:hypothetical protein Csa_001695 [Cucumis sativus]